jgi:hypothetical protein
MRPDEFFRGFDFGVWSIYVVKGERTGVETLLAIVAATTHLRSFQAFMSFVIAGHLALVSATAALGWSIRSRVRDAWFVGVLMAVSPETSLGVFNQLLGQVFGLAVFTAQIAFVSQNVRTASLALGDRLTNGATNGVLLAGQMLIYPELIPIAALSFVIVAVVQAVRGRGVIREALVPTAVALGVCALGSGSSLERMLVLIYSRMYEAQVGAPSGTGLSSAFPYFLLPSGLANLWGLTTLTTYQGALLSVAIAVGMLLTIAALAWACSRVFKAEPAAAALLIMAGLSIVGFASRNGFALFKLGMYAQPLLIVSLVALLGTSLRQRVARWVVVLVICAAGAATQWTYAQTSINGRFGVAGFVQVRDASSHHLLTSLAAIESDHGGFDAYATDTDNGVLARYEAGYVGSDPLFTFWRTFPVGPVTRIAPGDALRPDFLSELNYSRRLLRAVRPLVMTGRFSFQAHGAQQFTLPDFANRYSRVGLIHTGALGTVLNRSMRAYDGALVAEMPERSMRNDLVFVPTEIGEDPNEGQPIRSVSLFQLEPDYFNPGSTMEGIGRYLLFAVLRPTAKARMLMSISDSIGADTDRSLPRSACLIAGKREALPFVGDGSARIVSAPFETQQVGTYSLVGLDMGAPRKHFPVAREGLMKLYGREVDLDPRMLTAYARNISLISESEYQAMRPPTYLPDVRASLTNENVLYSGIYEDGWVSARANLTLSGLGGASDFVVRGFVPLIGDRGFATDAVITLDGRLVRRLHLPVGSFVVRVPVSASAEKHTVGFGFSATQRLPSGDGRPVAAFLNSVGFDR